MSFLRTSRHYALLFTASLFLLLGACGGGGGGGGGAPAATPVSGSTPAPAPSTGGGTQVPPSAPPPSDGGAAVPPANTGSGGGTGSTGGTGTATPAPAPDNAFRVSIDTRTLAFKGEEAGAMAPALVVGTGAGLAPPAVFTGSVDLGTALDRVLVEIDNMQVNFRVYPKLNLPAGEYRGSLQLFACPDEKCAQHFAGSPVTVPYSISISKAFSVLPDVTGFLIRSGDAVGTHVAVQVPEGASGYTVKTSADWLVAEDIKATGFQIVAQPMPPGTYSSTVTVTSGGRSKEFTIEYDVRGDPSTVMEIRPSRRYLDLNATIAGAANATLDVVLPSWSTVLDTEVAYTEGAPGGWLAVAKTGARTLALTASAATLPPGRHEARLILKSGPLATPVPVSVSFTVGLPTWRFTGNTQFSISSATTTAQLDSAVTVELPQVPSQAWTASTSSPWLSIFAGAGTTNGTPLRVVVDPAQLAGLENFATHNADVVLTAADSRVPPATLRFTLEKTLPDVQFVSPSTRLPGEAGTYILRGRGFDAVTDLQAGLQIGGATPLQLIRVNDTQVNVRLAGAASGAVEFNMPNGLGVPTGKPALQVVAQGVFPYRAVATAGNKGGLFFDPRRQALYSANKTLQTVMRFSWNGSSWSVASTPLPSIDLVAAAPDGRTLVASSTTSGIVLLDPDTLAAKGSYAAKVIGDTFNGSARMAVTNDGRAYFQTETWARTKLPYFDLVTRRFDEVSRTGENFDFYYGPWFSVSGDGSRLNIVQSNSISSMPPMLYMDSADRTPKANPAGIRFWYEASQSLRGERFAEDVTRVWDRDFAVIGDLALPGADYYYGRTPVLSPDGKRTYVLAYHGSVFEGHDNATALPRVYVFDSSTRMTVSTQLPLLGYFTLADYPSCKNSQACNTRPQGTISPDGKTLFFIGDVNLVAAPIPTVLVPAQATSLQRAAAGVAPQLQGLRMGR